MLKRDRQLMRKSEDFCHQLLLSRKILATVLYPPYPRILRTRRTALSLDKPRWLPRLRSFFLRHAFITISWHVSLQPEEEKVKFA